MWGRHILAGSPWRLLPQGCSNHPRSPAAALAPSSRPSLPWGPPAWSHPHGEPKVLLYITPGDVSIFIAVLKTHVFYTEPPSPTLPFPTPTKGSQTPYGSWGRRKQARRPCVGCSSDSNKQLLGGNTAFKKSSLKPRFIQQLLRMFVICRPCCRCHVTNDFLWWGLAIVYFFIYQLLA